MTDQGGTTPNFHSVICALGVFVFKLLDFNEIFAGQGQKDREHLTEGFGGPVWLVVGPYWLTEEDLVENKHWHWQNIPDRPDSRLISHPFFNVTPRIKNIRGLYTDLFAVGQPAPGWGHNASKAKKLMYSSSFSPGRSGWARISRGQVRTFDKETS